LPPKPEKEWSKREGARCPCLNLKMRKIEKTKKRGDKNLLGKTGKKKRGEKRKDRGVKKSTLVAITQNRYLI